MILDKPYEQYDIYVWLKHAAHNINMKVIILYVSSWGGGGRGEEYGEAGHLACKREVIAFFCK